MRQAKEQFNTRVFIFSDDDVAGNHAWAMELFEAIKPLKVRWASQCDILISRNDKLLAAMRANINSKSGLLAGGLSMRLGRGDRAGRVSVMLASRPLAASCSSLM